MARTIEIEPPHGPARAQLELRPRPPGALVLGHGAGGGVEAPDILAAARAAAGLGWRVVRVEQPYRVAGCRAPAPAPQLDAPWLAVVGRLRGAELAELRLVTGGRSSGGRVACRTASATGAAGVLCLAFPLQPAGRPNAPSRLPELQAVDVPVLVVQGERDPFGMPPEAPGRTVARVAGDHGLRRDPAAVAEAVESWLERFLR